MFIIHTYLSIFYPAKKLDVLNIYYVVKMAALALTEILTTLID